MSGAGCLSLLLLSDDDSEDSSEDHSSQSSSTGQSDVSSARTCKGNDTVTKDYAISSEILGCGSFGVV